MQRKFASIALAGALLLGGATAAHAAVSSPPEGGTWDRGTNLVWSYSKYFNQNKTHSSAVKDSSGNTKSSGWVAKNTWADARFTSRWPGVHYYYNVR
ncbi:lactococcin 972 family bacteriocin [Glutamicibacter sp. NPDC087673]|uniref:lactococcin 972 family bacteriocin n=1 Tax=Glutamicibacter sp. NPDC087673 TaxID=3363997 RepID=UPI00380B3AD4